MKFKECSVLFGAGDALALATAALAADKGFLWDGTQWKDMNTDIKVAYVKGIGNMADFETAAGGSGPAPCISKGFVDELKTKTIAQVIAEVDKFYQENPTKLKMPVIAVIMQRCTKLCAVPAGGEEIMRAAVILVMVGLMVGGLVASAPAVDTNQAFLWNGVHWQQVSEDGKAGYIFGIGNLADFEVAASKGKKLACLSQAFVDDLKTRTVMQIIQEVDKFYQDNPEKLDTPVIEVVLRRCTKVCPAETSGGEDEKMKRTASRDHGCGALGGRLFRHVHHAAADVERRRHRRRQRRPHRLGRRVSGLRRRHRRRGRLLAGMLTTSMRNPRAGLEGLSLIFRVTSW